MSLNNRDFDSAEIAFAQLSNVNCQWILCSSSSYCHDLCTSIGTCFRLKWCFHCSIFVRFHRKKNVKQNLLSSLAAIYKKPRDIIYKGINPCTPLCYISMNTIGNGSFRLHEHRTILIIENKQRMSSSFFFLLHKYLVLRLTNKRSSLFDKQRLFFFFIIDDKTFQVIDLRTIDEYS
jgi:hypothetical protein